jgi:branched-chain amino acid transport system substrate-binding protein
MQGLKLHRRSALLAVGMSALFLAMGPVQAADPLKIGVVAPLTGPAANSGIALRQGMELAADEWNAKGGVTIDGQKAPVTVIFEDSQSRPEVGVSAAQKMINRDKIDLLIGEAFHSSVTIALMELASQFKLPILSGEPVSTEISKKIEADPEKYKLFWKGDFNSEAYGEALRDVYKSIAAGGSFKPKNNTIAFVVEDTDYGRSNAAITAELFKKEGWNVVALETVPLGHADFYPQLTKMRSLQPDVLVSIFTSVNSGAGLVKQFQELGVSALHLGVYYPLRSEFFDQAGQAADGLVWVPMQYDVESNKEHAAFDKLIQQKFKTAGSSDHAFGHGILNVALGAVESAGSRDATKISDAIGKTNYKGVHGTWAFDQKNHTAKAGPEFIPVPAAQIQGGKNVVIWPEQRAAGKYQPQPNLR